MRRLVLATLLGAVSACSTTPDGEVVYAAASGSAIVGMAAEEPLWFYTVAGDSVWISSAVDLADSVLWLESWASRSGRHNIYYAVGGGSINVVTSASMATWAVSNQVQASAWIGVLPQSAFFSLIGPSENAALCNIATAERPIVRGPPSAGEELARAIGFTLCGDGSKMAAQVTPAWQPSADMRCRYYAFPPDDHWAGGMVVMQLHPDGAYRVVEVATFRPVTQTPMGLPNVDERVTENSVRAALGGSAAVARGKIPLAIWSADEHGIRVGMTSPDGLIEMLSGYLPNDCGELWEQ